MNLNINHHLMNQLQWRSANNDQLKCWVSSVDEFRPFGAPGSASSFRWKSHFGSWRMDVVFSAWTAVPWYARTLVEGWLRIRADPHIWSFTTTYTSVQAKSSAFFPSSKDAFVRTNLGYPNEYTMIHLFGRLGNVSGSYIPSSWFTDGQLNGTSSD